MFVLILQQRPTHFSAPREKNTANDNKLSIVQEIRLPKMKYLSTFCSMPYHPFPIVSAKYGVVIK